MTKRIINGWILTTIFFIVVELALRLGYISLSQGWKNLVNAWPYATGLVMLLTVLAALKYYLEKRNYPLLLVIGLIIALLGGMLVFMR